MVCGWPDRGKVGTNRSCHLPRVRGKNEKFDREGWKERGAGGWYSAGSMRHRAVLPAFAPPDK